jgi:hypothetical protein
VEDYGFDCYSASNAFHPTVMNSSYECIVRLEHGVFSAVGISISNNLIHTITFAARNGMLRLGDLALILGPPQDRYILYYVSWNMGSYRAAVETNGRLVSYFAPVRFISLQ